MAQQLWMLRHGEAVPHDSKPDAERELTPRGRRQAEAAGGALAALSEEFAACYTSPKVRARETAELACAHLNIEPVEEASLANGFSRVDALTLLEAHDPEAKVLIVGPRGGKQGMGLTLPEQLGEIPSTFKGYVWVEDIWTVGPALRSNRDIRTQAEQDAAEAGLKRRREAMK